MTGHRPAAAALLLALLALTPSLSVCSGWMSSAGDRMACCDHSRGGTQEMADTCCAHGERQQNAESPGLLGFALPAPQPLAWHVSAFVPPSPVSTFHAEAPEPSGSGSERRILLSVFLI